MKLCRLLLLSSLALANISALAQTDYTTDLPSVAGVEAGIQGSDPTDTLARQVAVFTYLQTYIQRIAYNRGVRAPYTAGEQKMEIAYAQAASQLTQDYGKSHTAAELTAFNQLHGRYEMDETFNDAWQKSLIGPLATAAYNGSVSSMAAGEAAHVTQEQQQYQQDTAAQQTTGSGNVMSNDPTSVAARRCLELGGSNSQCLGSSLIGGIVSLFTGGTGLGALIGPGRAGVVLSGVYKTPGAATSLNFAADTTGIDGCGDLQEVSSPYTISKSAAATQVVLQSTPSPIALSMGSDGSLTGPALVNITGQVITGYNTVTNTQMINGARAAANQCNGPCQTISQVPVYAAKTVRCSLASFAPPAPPPPPSASSSDSSPLGGLFGAITGAVGAVASLPGLRMEGQYSSSTGLILNFAGDAVTVDCGQAHVKAPYTVVNGPASFTISVQNSGGPFNLTLTSGNALQGSGTITVNGRLVSGMNGDNVTFTPHSESCTVATFTPQSAVASSTVSANVAPTPAPAPRSAPAAPAPAASVPAAAASGAGIKLNVTSTFPTATNPLAGKPVSLMTDRLDNAMRAIGAPIPAGTTPGQALQAWAYACNPPKDCTAPAKLMANYYVGRGTFDNTGKVVLAAPVAPGNYYVLTSVAGTKGVLVWDMPVTLKASDNTVNLTATNAELVPITPAQ